MRSLCLTLIAGAALAVAPTAIADANAGTGCPAQGAHVVASNARAVVFTKRTDDGLAYYGCRRGHQPQRFAVGDPRQDPWSENFVVDVALKDTTVSWTLHHVPGQSCRYANPCAPESRKAFSLKLR
jgi:hypothetical protein